MKRRSVIAVAATVPFAGCGVLGGDDGMSASLDASSSDFEDHVSDSFEASQGDELEVTIEAGDDGANLGLLPEEEQGASFGDQIGWSWTLEANEEVTDTVEVEQDDTYVFWIVEGSADVSAE